MSNQAVMTEDAFTGPSGDEEEPLHAGLATTSTAALSTSAPSTLVTATSSGDAAIAHLVDMGFDFDASCRALESAGWVVETAVGTLCAALTPVGADGER